MIGPEDLLKLRALRMLTDGQRHDAGALHWARWLLALDAVVLPDPNPERDGAHFTDRELSLGAQRSWT